MTRLPMADDLRRLDRHWLRAVGFTLALVGLVTLALGAELWFTLTALVTCGVGFGFFYFLFATGSQFGLTMANGLAFYVCLFSFFRDANFAEAPLHVVLVALALPVVAFLGGCFHGRHAIGRALRARHDQEPTHLPRLSRWLPGLLVVGSLSFALPRFDLDPMGQALALLASMAAVGAFVAYAARDIVVLLLDITILFESVAGRLRHLAMPIVAFLTYYALLIMVFTCLYRIAEMALGEGQFRVHGEAGDLTFAQALYFSVITMATVGYGDIVPEGALVRALAASEVVCGVLLLLFGFSEIMRAREVMLHARDRTEPAKRPEAPH